MGAVIAAPLVDICGPKLCANGADCTREGPVDCTYHLEWIALNLIQIEGNPRPVQAGNVAIVFLRVNPNKSNTL
jgi:hypothetical protein